jgi:predicted nucleotidyltransferase
MRLTVRGRDLPGSLIAGYRNVHVGLRARRDPAGLVRGDASDATWVTDVTVLDGPHGGDHRGEAVQGRRLDPGAFEQLAKDLRDFSSEFPASRPAVRVHTVPYASLVVSERRADEVESVLRHLTDWARRRSDVRALALVGSWARGAAHEGSDVDVVLLTDSPELYVDSVDWLRDVDGVRLVRTLAWGAVTERRFAIPSGLEIELDVGTPRWASVDPIDAGTRRVVADGMRVLHDPDGLLRRLVTALQQRS